MFRKSLLVFVIGLALTPASALAQAPLQPTIPMVLDFKKVEVGSWSSYSISMGKMSMQARFALVARDASSVTMENSIEGGMMAMLGGKMTLKVVMEPDPTTAAKPVKQMAMQIGNQDPTMAPNGVHVPKYSKPDPSTMVGKETIKVAAGSFKTTHYRSNTPQGIVDVWVSEEVAPTGMVKLMSSGAMGTGSGQPPGMMMELVEKGKGAKPIITKAPKPYDSQKAMGGMVPAGDPRNRSMP
jgi:hypothetical protein